MTEKLWRTTAFMPDTTGWDAVYGNTDGTFLRVPIAGWLLQEETRADSFGRYFQQYDDEIRETRVVAADLDGGIVEPCLDSKNFKYLMPRKDALS